MKKNAPNRVITPIFIAGVTVGFLAAAYKFVYAKTQSIKPNPDQAKHEENLNQVSDEQEQ